ncbi:carbohydrate kinase family protein [candidate division KSB1 bacterium]|nr:carbohydrate kinase family protein [candidate division KSB1 bacterium]
MKNNFDVIVVGELNVDIILNQIDSFPEMGKEKLASSMSLTLGSSSAIFASNLSSMGAKVGFIGKTGKDTFADLVLDSLQAKNVDTSMIIQDDSLATGATIVLNFDQDRAMVTHPGAMNYLILSDISPDHLKQGKHLHFASCFLQPGIKPDLANLFKSAKELGLTTSFDPQWDPAEKWDIDIEEILPHVDIFLPNKVEALLLSGEKDIETALDKLARIGNIIVIKLGEKGSILKHGNKVIKATPFLNTNVVDAIGAGDSFNTGFVYKFIQGEDIRVCQTFANLTGALNTTEPGGTAAFTTMANILKIGKERFGYKFED